MTIREVSSSLGMYYDTTHRMVAKLRHSAYPDLIAINLTTAALHQTQTANSERAGLLLRQVMRDMKTAA